MNRMRAEKRGLTYPPPPKANGVLEWWEKKIRLQEVRECMRKE